MTITGLRDRWIVRGERGGSVAVETVLIVPVFVLILGVITAGARIAIAEDAVTSAAGNAARAASLARTAGEARADAESVAAATLATSGLSCSTSSVQLDVSEFQRPVGQPATVQVQISCQAPLSDLLVPGLGGSRLLVGTASSPLDRFRGRR